MPRFVDEVMSRSCRRLEADRSGAQALLELTPFHWLDDAQQLPPCEMPARPTTAGPARAAAAPSAAATRGNGRS
eukprot:14017256-Alexandrium_andersonii.AAC.1